MFYANSVIEAEQRDTFVQEGSAAKGYAEVSRLLQNYYDYTANLERLVVFYAKEDMFHVLFDIMDWQWIEDAEHGNVKAPNVYAQKYGDVLRVDDVTRKNALESLEITMLMQDYGDYVFRDGKDYVYLTMMRLSDVEAQEDGKCYALAVIRAPYIPADVFAFIVRVVIEFLGFSIVLLGFGFWIAGYYMVYPITGMSEKAEAISEDINDLSKLEENIEQLQALDIRTNDELETLYHAMCQMAYGLTGRMQALQNLFCETVTAMVNAIDAKYEYTRGHSVRVAEYSKRIAELSGKKERECEEVYLSALLHDVGKIGIPGAIINKNGKLDDEEYSIIKQHPQIGKQILEGIQEYPYLSVAAHYHHERYDGKGYPEGLKGEDIPEIARIVAVADAYDAMTSKRSYRDAIPQQTVREEIIKGMGTQFDPQFAKIMQHMIDLDTEYDMREKEKAAELVKRNELSCRIYKERVSEGFLLTEKPVRIRFTCKAMEGFSASNVIPTLLLYDALDGKYHTEEKAVKDFVYFEYGEIRLDGQTNCTGARKMQSDVSKKKHADVDKDDRKNLERSRNYEARLMRHGDHVMAEMTDGTQSCKVIVALPDKTRYAYAALTGHDCHISGICVENEEQPIDQNTIPRIAEEISYIKGKPEGDVPNVQTDGYRTAASKGILITDGMQIRFHSMSLPTARLVWHCPFVVLYHSDDQTIDGPNYREFSLIRLDGEYWETDKAVKGRSDVMHGADFVGWEEWKKRNKEGIDCVVTFRKAGSIFTTTTENLGISITNVTELQDGTQEAYVAIMGDQCALTDIRILKRS